MYFGKDEKAIDFYFKGAVPGEYYDLLFFLIEVSLKSEPSYGEIGVFDVVFWGLILGDGGISENRPYFSLDAVVELVIFGFIVAWAPVMEVAVDAVLYLDMHGSFNLIILLICLDLPST